MSFGLAFAALDLLYGISTDLRSPLTTFDFYFVPLVLGFVIFSLATAFLVLVKKLIGYVLAIIVSLGFVLPSIPVFLPTLSNPINFETYVIALTSVPVLILVAFFAILSLLNSLKWTGQKKSLESPRSLGGVITGIVLIFIIVGVAIGAATPKVLAAKPIQISIVHGAGTPSLIHSFSPDNITLVLGVNSTVVFTNDDFTIHTVTDRGGIFSSGLLNQGDHWTLTLTKPGTYVYYCIIHQSMVGRIFVKG
jgi:plastocyanin